MKKPSTVSGKRPVTVAQEIRKPVGRSVFDRVQVMVEETKTVIRPRGSEINPFEKYKGALKSSCSRKAISAWIREMRDEETHHR